MVDMTSIGIPQSFQDFPRKKVKFSHDSNEHALQCEVILAWLKNAQGNAIFHGGPGRAKSYTAVTCMCHFNQKHNIPWHDMRFINIPDLFQDWMANMENYSMNAYKLSCLKEVRVLVLDDLGVRKPSDGFLDYIHCLIDARYNKEECITIFTTNLTGQEFNQALGPRIISRASSGIKISFEGPDYRKTKTQLEGSGESKIHKMTQTMGQ